MTTPQQTNLNAFLGRIGSNSLTSADQTLLTQALTGIISTWGFGGTGAGPDDTGGAGQSDEQNAREWFAPLYAIAQIVAGGGPVVPPSWLVPAWFIDPVAGNDLNNGQTALTALKTWAQLVNLWGTNAPTLRQSTTITFLSSQPDNTDPVIFRPVVGNGAVVEIVGTPAVVTAGVILAGTVAKNRATGVFLQTNLGATSAQSQLVQNTTHPSRAFVYANVAGNVWKMSQPLGVAGIPVSLSAPPLEIDTWANGDSVNLLSLPNVAVVEVRPTIADPNAADDNQVYLVNLNLFAPAPGAAGVSTTVLGAGVQCWECSSSRQVAIGGVLPNALGPQTLQVVLGNFADSGGLVSANTGNTVVIGGYARVGAWALSGSFIVDGDFIVGVGSSFSPAGTGPSNFGFVGVDAVTAIIGPSGEVFASGVFYGGQVIYGAGATLSTLGTGRMRYGSGAGAAVATFTIPTLKLNNATTAHSVIAGTPDTFNGAIGLTAAALDAAAGAAGFGGNAFVPGGASMANTA